MRRRSRAAARSPDPRCLSQLAKNGGSARDSLAQVHPGLALRVLPTPPPRRLGLGSTAAGGRLPADAVERTLVGRAGVERAPLVAPATLRHADGAPRPAPAGYPRLGRLAPRPTVADGRAKRAAAPPTLAHAPGTDSPVRASKSPQRTAAPIAAHQRCCPDCASASRDGPGLVRPGERLRDPRLQR